MKIVFSVLIIFFLLSISYQSSAKKIATSQWLTIELNFENFDLKELEGKKFTVSKNYKISCKPSNQSNRAFLITPKRKIDRNKNSSMRIKIKRIYNKNWAEVSFSGHMKRSAYKCDSKKNYSEQTYSN